MGKATPADPDPILNSAEEFQLDLGDVRQVLGKSHNPGYLHFLLDMV